MIARSGQRLLNRGDRGYEGCSKFNFVIESYSC